MRALQAALRLGPLGARWAVCRASTASLYELEDTAAAFAGGLSFYSTSAADGAGVPASSSAADGACPSAASADAWVAAGSMPLSQAVSPFASLEQRHAAEAQQQQQQPGRSRGRQRREAAVAGPPSDPLPALGPRQLLRALQEAGSPRKTAQLLVEHRDVAGPRHLIAAALRMGELQSEKRGAPRHVNQEAFSGALDLALEMLRQAGQPLQFGDACCLLDAAAWMRVQLTQQQAAALEAAVVAGLTSGAKLKSTHMRLMLSAYIRLGLQPGPDLARALAPGQCLVTVEDDEELVEGSEQHKAAAANGTQAAAAAGAADTAAASEAATGAATGAAAAAAPADSIRLMDEGQLSVECVQVQSLRRLLRVALLHRQQLTLPQLLAALRNFGERVHEEPRQLSPSVQAAFGALRAQALASLATAGPDAFPKLPDVATCAQLLQASADLQLPLTAAEQAAVEDAAVRGWEEARMAELHMIAVAYDALDMQPLRGSGMAAQLQQAGEWLLQAALPRQLAETMSAWAGRHWPVSPAMAAAAEHRALQLLEPVAGTCASSVILALEGFVAGQSLFPMSSRLATAMRAAVLHHLPEASAEFVSLVLSACRKLRLLPDQHLLDAFVEAAPRVLPVDSEVAHAFVPRLLMALQMQGWQYSGASPAVRSTVEALLRKQRVHTESIVADQHPTPEELRSNLGLLAHNLQLLAAVGIRPSDQDLSLVLRYLRRHQRVLSRSQLERLKTAFDAWQLPSTVRRLRVLRR